MLEDDHDYEEDEIVEQYTARENYDEGSDDDQDESFSKCKATGSQSRAQLLEILQQSLKDMLNNYHKIAKLVRPAT